MIDAHVHLYPPEVVRDPAMWAETCGEVHWHRLCTRRRKGGDPVQLFPTVDELLADMDAAGIESAVLLGWYWERADTCRAQNRFYAGIVRAHPGRFHAFAAVHPGDAGEVRRELRWAKENGFRGVGELSPHSQGVPVAGDGWRTLLRTAGELEMPVNVHVTDPLTRPFLGRVDTPLADFAAMAREFPATKFILAHWGGGLAFDPASRAWSNVWYDTAASPIMYDASVWKRAADAVGVERIIFGSDYPLRLYPKAGPGAGLEAFVEEARRESGGSPGILRENVLRLL
jgi:uncharacterized protein